MIKYNGLSIIEIGENLYYNEEHGFYSTLINGKIKDTHAWVLLMKYANIIYNNEKRDVLIRAINCSIDGDSMLSFYIETIDEEEALLIKELYPAETCNGFCIVCFKNTLFLVTRKGEVISGNDIINKVLSERAERESFSLKGMGFSALFFHGWVEYAITTELFLRPMRECMKGDRVQVKDQETYLLLDKISMLVKIGRSADIPQRIKQLSISNENLVLLAYSKRGEIETVLHHHYKEKKKSREWYALTTQDIDWIIKEFKMNVSHKKWKSFFKQDQP